MAETKVTKPVHWNGPANCCHELREVPLYTTSDPTRVTCNRCKRLMRARGVL